MKKVIELINPSKILVCSTNYIQYVDQEGNFKECQYDYRQKKWYSFQSIGVSISPVEKFINWLT